MNRNSSWQSTTTLGSLANLERYWPLAAAGLLLIAARFEYSGLGHYDPFYDSGVYLESARMMRRGYAAYETVFSSQPPLWLPLLRHSFFLFGESFYTGQLVVATAALVTVAAVFATVAQLQGRPSAILAAAVVILAPTQLMWSRIVIAEVPAMAFAGGAVALAARYFRVRRRLWLVLASIAITCSILTKLFGVYTVPAIVLLVIARWLNAPEPAPRAYLAGLGLDLLIMAASAAGVMVLLTSGLDLRKVWDQAVRFHLSARISQVSGVGPWQRMLQLLQWDSLLWAVAPLSIFCVFGGWGGLAALTWMFSSIIGLLLMKPLFGHHLIALVPALAVAAGLGWGQLWRWPLRWASQAETSATRLVAAGTGAACVAVGLLLASQLLGQATAAEKFRRRAASRARIESAAEVAAQQLRKLTLSNDVVLTDAQGIAFLANRDVPPGLTDTSVKRISARYLSARDVIDESERFHVSAVLLWSGRLRRMPAVVAWITTQFTRHQSFGNGRGLYLRTIPSTTN